MNQPTFGAIVKEQRMALGLTQSELARRVGCAIITIRKIEYDALRPSVQIAERLALALTIPEEEQLAFVRLARAAPPASPLPTPPPSSDEIGRADLSGRAIRGFELGERLGSGGYGVVYRAMQTAINRDVAIKLILPQYADQPDFIRRFEAEAQLVAQLEHPNIVPLYDYWREPSAAFLVMRLLRGGSLETLLAEGPLETDLLLPMLTQIGAALHTAHRAGVVHRDIKPANILLDADQNAYLADFGIAKDVSLNHDTQPGAVVGSPAYFSPEQINAEPVKPQTDIYCLGIMLFELLTGQRPFSGPSPLAYIQQHLGESLPSLATYRPNLPPSLDTVLDRATAKQVEDRYPDTPALLSDFQQAIDGGPSPVPLTAFDPTTLTNPYKGLHPFNESDADDFFGRDTLVQTLLTRISETDAPSTPSAGQDLARFLAVVGPSGSGKSSAVKAGLLPVLRRGGLPKSEQWFITEMTPGAHPWEELETALLRIAINPPPTLLNQLQADQRGLLRAVQRILPADPAVELVLVIDQFEELFTMVENDSVRAGFLGSLVTAILDERSRLRVVITLRADFLDRPLQYVDFGELLHQRTEFVLPLSPDELEEVISTPVARRGLALEPGLTADIIRDVGDQPGTLPLLQYALTELFERREGRRLTRTAYQASGGVLGALARRADELYNTLDNSAQELVRQLFLRLITPGEGTEDMRRRVLRSELEAIQTAEMPDAPEISSQIIDMFGRYRLLTFDHDPANRAPTVEVAHEALLREWQQLRGWLADSRTDLRMQRQLAAAYADWQAAGQDPSFLLHGTRLAQFEEWALQTQLALTADEQAIFNASLVERDRQLAAEQERQARELALQQRAAQRLRWLVVGLSLFLLAAAGLAAIAFNQQARAEANFTRAEAQRLAAEANTLVQAGDNAEIIALLAVKSVETQYSPQGDAALQAAAGLDYPQRILDGHEGSVWAVDFSPDSRQVVTGIADGTARLWDIATGEQVQEFIGHEDEIISVAFGPDGRTVLTGSFDQTARLWDVQTGLELHQFVEPDATEVNVAFSPDGQYALTGAGGGGVVHLWRVDNGERVQTLTGNGDEIIGVAMSPDARLVAAGSQAVFVWDVASGDLVQIFDDPAHLVLSVAFSPDGRTLAGGSYDKVAWLWDIETGELLQTFEGHSDAVEKVRFSPDGQTLLTVSDDRTARLWNIETGQEIRQMVGHASPVFGAAFAPDGRSIATASFDQTAKLWNIQAQPEWPPLAGVSPGSFANAVGFTANGDAVLGAGPTGLLLWNSQTGQILRRFDYETPLLSAALAPDAGQAWGGAVNGKLPGWDTETGEPLQTFTGHEAEIVSVAVSPDGRYALTAGASDGTARLWDLATGQPAQIFSPKAGFVLDVAFSPDGRHALASTASGAAFMWTVDGGELIRQFELEGLTGMPSLVMSPNGEVFVAGSRFGDVVLFDAGSGQQQRIFSGHTDVVRDLTFSPDGALLLSASADGTARLWDVATGAELRRYNRKPFTVHSAAFAPDGRTVLVAGNDGLAQRFDVDYQETVDYLCHRLQRDFTDHEREQYGISGEVSTCRHSLPFQ